VKLPVWFLLWGLLATPAVADNPVSVNAHGFVAFNRIDSDHNGYVSRVEARSVGVVEAVFDSADIDRDGLLNRDEYTSVRSVREANPS
jgi:EF hand